jgi:hypothetical protein
MPLSDDIRTYVDGAVAAALSRAETATGTVVTSPSQRSTDPLTVAFDGSAVAVPVKQIRLFPLFPGMRVALVKLGSDWTVIGSFSNPSTGTGSMRMTMGVDTPPELMFFGVEVAWLLFVTDKDDGVELGYFFIGISNKLDGSGDEKVCLFGHCTYPTPGDPASPAPANVRTHHQMNLAGSTVFKDHLVRFFNSVPRLQLDSNVDFNLLSTGSSLSGSQGRGVVNWAFFNSASASVTAETIVATMTGCTFKSGRAYRVVPFGGYLSANAGALCHIQVRKTDLAGPVVADFVRVRCEGASLVVNGLIAGDGFGTLRRDPALADLTGVTLVQTIQSAGGAGGTVTAFGDATHPRGVKLHDIGTFDDYAEGFAVT